MLINNTISERDKALQVKNLALLLREYDSPFVVSLTDSLIPLTDLAIKPQLNPDDMYAIEFDLKFLTTCQLLRGFNKELNIKVRNSSMLKYNNTNVWMHAIKYIYGNLFDHLIKDSVKLLLEARSDSNVMRQIREGDTAYLQGKHTPRYRLR